MKRAGNLFETICSWENLELAARRARRHKRYRGYVERFELRRESVLAAIRAQLLDGSWRPLPMREFRIFDPKERLISAPAYRDRIVHHALCNVIGPILERTMIAHSYSCRVGLGTGAAREYCRKMVARTSHVLKMDVRHYFPSIDHAILKGKLRRHIKCRSTLELADRIIDGWRSTDGEPAWFAGDDLLTAADRPHGLPIGALTSQLFANLYLSRIDHLVEEDCKTVGYARYTDDLLVFGNDKRRLGAIRETLMMEQQREELSVGEPQRQRSRQSQQQHRLPGCCALSAIQSARRDSACHRDTPAEPKDSPGRMTGVSQGMMGGTEYAVPRRGW